MNTEPLVEAWSKEAPVVVPTWLKPQCPFVRSDGFCCTQPPEHDGAHQAVEPFKPYMHVLLAAIRDL